MSAPTIKKLKNGLTLVLAPKKATEVVSLIVYIGAGSRYEDERVAGMTHFLEHMLFDGTQKRPTSFDISKEIDAIGADVNAHPTEEYTNFHIKSAAEHFETIVDIISDMLLNSRLTETDIVKEKKVVIEEIKMRTDIPSSYIFDVFDQAIFAGNPLGRYTGGTPETVNGISRADVLNFYRKYYSGDNIYISVCGNFGDRSADQVVKLIESKFSFALGMPALNKSTDFSQKKLNFLDKDCQQTNFAVGYYGCRYKSADRFALKLLSIILGGNMSSRMFSEIREKRGLAYDVRTFSTSLSDTGTIMTVAGVADEKAAEALAAILEEYQKIKSGVTVAELDKAKTFLTGQLKITLEDTYELGDFYLSQVFQTGKAETLSEISKNIAKITTSDLKKLANKYFDNKYLSIAVIAKESVKKEIKK